MTVSYRAHIDDQSSESPFTFAAVDIGTASASRVVAVLFTNVWVAGAPESGFDPTAVTIGGISAVKIISEEDASVGAALSSSIWTAIVPTGTTADIVVSYTDDGSFIYWSVDTWALGAVNATASDTAASFALSGGATLDISVDVVNGTAVVGGGIFVTGGDPEEVTWVGATENNDSPFIAPTLCVTAGSISATGTETPRTITVTGVETTDYYLGVSAAFAPSSTPQNIAALLSGVGSLSASAAVLATDGANLDGVGNLFADANVKGIENGNALLPGVGTLAASTTLILRCAALLDGVGSLRATGILTLQAAALLPGVGNLNANGGFKQNISALLSGVGALRVDATVRVGVAMANARLPGIGSLSVYIPFSSNVRYWPASVPQEITTGSYTESPERNVIEFKPEVGPPKIRRQYSQGFILYQFSTVMTHDELDALQTFYRDDLEDGVLTFMRKKPRNSAGADHEFQFTSVPSFRSISHDTGEVQMTMRLIA